LETAPHRIKKVLSGSSNSPANDDNFGVDHRDERGNSDPESGADFL
jgi:hypothetical protein